MSSSLPPPDPDRLERALRSDSLLPLPSGLVAKVLARIAAEPLPTRATSDAGPVRRSLFDGGARVRLRPGRLVAMAAAALLALGAGIGGLWSATTGDGLGVFGSPDANSPDSLSAGSGAVAAITTASIADLAAAARASTSASVRSLAQVPDQMPGSPVALGAGSLVLLGAAIVGARRRVSECVGERATGPESDADSCIGSGT